MCASLLYIPHSQAPKVLAQSLRIMGLGWQADLDQCDHPEVSLYNRDIMSGIDYDLKYVAASLSELNNYLLSKELFWLLNLSSAPGETPYPKLTSGNLLLSFARLKAYKMAALQNTEFTRLEMDLDVLKNKWRVAWEKKVNREFTSRLRQWGEYLNELARDQTANAVYYRNEVRLRVLLELLLDELGEDSHPELTTLDVSLRANSIGGDFIWDEELAGGFPKKKYWFLWGDVKGR